METYVFKQDNSNYLNDGFIGFIKKFINNYSKISRFIIIFFAFGEEMNVTFHFKSACLVSFFSLFQVAYHLSGVGGAI
jgi:hypothetical protein